MADIPLKRAPKKVTINYKNGKIYKVVNDVNDIIYVGSTTSTLSRRFTQHKNNCKRAETKNSRFYTAVNEIGIEHFKIILIEAFPCASKAELEAREYAVTNAVDKALVYNSRFDGKPDAALKARMIAENPILGVRGEASPNFRRGCITNEVGRSRFNFMWQENRMTKHKTYCYGGKRTREEAYMLCLSMQEEIYPLSNMHYLDQLPFAE